MVNACQKGKRGEREFAKWLRENLGVQARRGRQFSGSPESPDVVGLDGVHFEVKRTECLNLWNAMEQAKRDCGANIPVVACKRNRSKWMLTIEAEKLMALIAAVSACQDQDLEPIESQEFHPRTETASLP